MRPGFAIEGRMHLHCPILDPEGPKLSLRDAPSLGKANDRVVVIAPEAGRAPVGPLVPGVHGCAHRRMLGVRECHKDVRVVVARCGEPCIGMSEHLPEASPGPHGRDAGP